MYTKIHLLLYLFNLLGERVVTYKHTISLTFKNKALIRVKLKVKIKLIKVHPSVLCINLINQIRIYTLNSLLAPVKNIHISNLIIDVVLRNKTKRTSFHAKVNILGHKDSFHARILFGNLSHN